jgi:hypothetical protein
MLPESAVELISALCYKPGWSLSATDCTHRHEGAVVVHVSYPAYPSERDQAAAGYPGPEQKLRANFPLLVGDCDDDVELYRRVLGVLLEVETHEAREFLRVRPTWWAPFHPHRIDGMRRWGTPEQDLRFGVGA